MAADLNVILNGTLIPVYLGENTALASRYANEAEASAATALAASGPNYANTAAGLTATTVGETFAVDNGDDTITVYSHDSGPVATELRTYPKDILGMLASTDVDKGAGLPAYDYSKSYADGTTGAWFNILDATLRPAMRGIFSSGSDQRAALLDFVADAAAGGKTIEWGPIDLTLDVVTLTGSVRGLGVPSGSRWVFHPDTRLRAVPNNSDSYCILNMYEVEDVVIEGGGARLIGEKGLHTNPGGQVGNGLGCGIRGCRNITVRDLIAEDCWGDGFYVGSSTNLAYSQDVLLDNVRGRNNARQGFSLISARNMVCRDSVFSGTDGLSPEAGVDIEPNLSTEYLEAIRFQNVRTSSNGGAGFLIFLSAMAGSSNKVDITVDGLDDDGSNYGIQLGYGSASALAGRIRFLNPRLASSQLSAIAAVNYRISGPKVVIDDPILVDWNRAAGTSNKYNSAISLYAESSSTGTTALGNVEINRPRYVLNSGSPASGTYLLNVTDERSTTPDPATSIRHIDPIEAPSETGTFMNAGQTNSTVTLRDRFSTIAHALPNADEAVGGFTSFSRYTIPAVTANRAYTVSNVRPIGSELEFVVTGVGAGQGRITFGSGPVLVPLDSTADGFYIYSTQDGARIRIRKTAANRYEVIEQVGTWTAV